MRLWTPHPGSFTWLDVMMKGLLARTVTGWGGEKTRQQGLRLGALRLRQSFPGASSAKNPPPRQETQETRVRSPGGEDPLEKEMATHSSVLAGKSHGQRSLAGHSLQGHKESDTTAHLSTLTSLQRLCPPWQGSAGWEGAGVGIRTTFWSASSEASQLGSRPTGPPSRPF